MNDSETFKPTDEELRQYEEVRLTGKTNMLMQTNVRDIADQLGFRELVFLIDRGDYPDLLEAYDSERARELVEG